MHYLGLKSYLASQRNEIGIRSRTEENPSLATEAFAKLKIRVPEIVAAPKDYFSIGVVAPPPHIETRGGEFVEDAIDLEASPVTQLEFKLWTFFVRGNHREPKEMPRWNKDSETDPLSRELRHGNENTTTRRDIRAMCTGYLSTREVFVVEVAGLPRSPRDRFDEETIAAGIDIPPHLGLPFVIGCLIGLEWPKANFFGFEFSEVGSGENSAANDIHNTPFLLVHYVLHRFAFWCNILDIRNSARYSRS